MIQLFFLGLRPHQHQLIRINLGFRIATFGYGSISIETYFSGMNIHKSQLFWGSLGTRVLTHPHLILPLPSMVGGCLNTDGSQECLIIFAWKHDNKIPSGYVNIAIENGSLEWIFPLKMVIFHSYVNVYQRVQQANVQVIQVIQPPY